MYDVFLLLSTRLCNIIIFARLQSYQTFTIWLLFIPKCFLLVSESFSWVCMSAGTILRLCFNPKETGIIYFYFFSKHIMGNVHKILQIYLYHLLHIYLLVNSYCLFWSLLLDFLSQSYTQTVYIEGLTLQNETF